MNKFAIAASLAAALALQSTAHAGHSFGFSVYINGSFADGSLRAVRSSSNTTEHIGCTIYTTTNYSGYRYLSCSAVDPANNQLYCALYNPPDSWLQLVSGINEASSLYFERDSSGQCVALQVGNDSDYL